MTAFKKVARTTGMLEEVLRQTNKILSRRQGFGWRPFSWSHREFFATEVIDSGHSETSCSIFVNHEKLIKVVGVTTMGHKVQTVAKFEGYTHERSSGCFDDDGSDHSKDLELQEIAFEITTSDGKKIERVYCMKDGGTTFELLRE